MIKRIAALPQFKIWLSTAVCCAAFIAFLFILQFTIPLSILLVAVLYLGLHLLLFPVDPQSKLHKQTINEARRRVEALRLSAGAVQNRIIQRHVYDMIGITEQVIELIRSNPDVLPQARKLVTFYLEHTAQLLDKYCALQGQKYMNAPTVAFLNRMEALILELKDSFEAQYNKLLRNDLSDISVKMDMLQEMLEWEETT